MTSFGGVIKNDHLVLSGKCSTCHGEVARVIEANLGARPCCSHRELVHRHKFMHFMYAR